MKKRIINKIFLGSIIIVIIVAFIATKKSDSNEKYKKIKTFSKVVRLIDEQYVEEVDFDLLMEGAISGMLNKLDPHSSFINTADLQKTTEEFDGEFEGIGIEFSIIDDYITVITPIIDGPSEKAGIISGDKIVKINGESAFQISTVDVLKKLKGPKGTEVEVTIKREGADLFNRLLIRDKIPLKSVISHFMLENSVGYIKLGRFSKKTFEEFYNAYNNLESQGMKNLLLDLRDNPGGLLDQAISILDMFISSNDTLLYTKGRIWGANDVFNASYSQYDKKIPVITLINRGSASASEIVSGAFQDLDRGLVLGETSFGKGSVQRQYDLDDSSATRITIAKYYTPSGRSIQRSYSEGVDEYYMFNLNNQTRELTDSLKQTLPAFKTKQGRLVYGGGGITPDIFYKDTTTVSKSTLEIVFDSKRPLFNYAENIKHKYIKIDDYQVLNDLYNNTNNDFIEWLEKNDYKFEKEDIVKDWDYINNRIFAEVSNKLFNRNFYYKSIINNDNMVKEALKYFEDANELLN